MKYVIQTHRSYEQPLMKLLSTMNGKIKNEELVLVYGDEDIQTIYRRADGVTVIKMKCNFWEYTAIIALKLYMEHSLLRNTSSFFLLHDTCYVDNADTFARNTKAMREHLKEGYDFVYPSTHRKKNIGLASRHVISTFGYHLMKIPEETFTKAHGVYLEGYLRKHYKIKTMDGFEQLGIKSIDGHRRRLNFFPYISLYKHNGVEQLQKSGAYIE